MQSPVRPDAIRWEAWPRLRPAAAGAAAGLLLIAASLQAPARLPAAPHAARVAAQAGLVVVLLAAVAGAALLGYALLGHALRVRRRADDDEHVRACEPPPVPLWAYALPVLLVAALAGALAWLRAHPLGAPAAPLAGWAGGPPPAAPGAGGHAPPAIRALLAGLAATVLAAVAAGVAALALALLAPRRAARRPQAATDREPATAAPRPAPVAPPHADPSAWSQWPPREAVQAAFRAALRAARAQGLRPSPAQTPREFAAAVAQRRPELADAFATLTRIYERSRFSLWDRISPTSHFTNAFALLSSCYLLDFFVSTADPYPFGELLWVFMVFSSFFLTMLYIGEEWALLLKVLVIAIGEQCLYAIIYYFLSFNQFIVLALSGTAFVRTMGRPVGNPEDRSFWGRFAIWQTALHVIADHPLLGNGLNTYPQKQREHMTERLKYFNPLNVEAKNLYLHLAAELGLIGLAVFCWVAWRYYQLFRFVIGTFPPSSDLYKIAIGIHAALIGIAVAGLADTPILHHSRSAATFAVACLLGLLCSSVNHACPAPVVDDDTLRKRRQRFWRGVGFVVVASCLPITYFSWHVGVGVKKAFEAFPKVQELAFRLPKTTSYVRLKEIAPVMRDAVVAFEDGYFYFHHGVDWLALHRALRKNIRALRFKQGGSTITMQLARYLFLGRERTLARKVAEIILALKMEQLLPKDRILELYLNTARFGMGEDGLFAAAQNYFGKQPKDLNLAEAAFLAGVLPEPPFDQRNVTPELVRRCQQRVFERLRAFFPERYPPEVIQEAQKTPLKFRWGTVVILSEGVNENGGH